MSWLKAAECGQHAFVVLGPKTIFLCHLTMFKEKVPEMALHQYQLVLRPKLPPDAIKAYERLRNEAPTRTVFVANTEHDHLAVPDLKTGAKTTFQADMFGGVPKGPYTGWPWQGITPDLANFTVTVDTVVYYRRFDKTLNPPKHLTYVVFGEGDEAHMQHYQIWEPEFDHIRSLSAAPKWIPKRELTASVDISFPDLPSTPVTCQDPFTKDRIYKALLCGQGTPQEVPLGQTHWFSTDVPNHPDPCDVKIPPGDTRERSPR